MHRTDPVGSHVASVVDEEGFVTSVVPDTIAKKIRKKEAQVMIEITEEDVVDFVREDLVIEVVLLVNSLCEGVCHHSEEVTTTSRHRCVEVIIEIWNSITVVFLAFHSFVVTSAVVRLWECLIVVSIVVVMDPQCIVQIPPTSKDPQLIMLVRNSVVGLLCSHIVVDVQAFVVDSEVVDAVAVEEDKETFLKDRKLDYQEKKLCI
jgi:hypothetical protein